MGWASTLAALQRELGGLDGEGAGESGVRKGVRKETARKKRSARIEGQREATERETGAKDRQTVGPPVVGEGPCTLAALLGEGPSTLLSWSRSGRSCPFQYRGALSFLRPCAGPARLVVVGTHPEKGATQATHSGSNPALHGSQSSAHCPSQILVLLPQLHILPSRWGCAGGRERVKESKASSAVQGLEVRIAGLGGRWAGALLPALSEGHEAWGIAGIAFTCC